MRAPASEYVSVGGRPWQERRSGVHWKVLHEDGDRRTVLVRYEAGAIVPRHRHLGDEQIFVIEGSVSDETGTCHAGDFARRPPGCVHTVRSAGGALVLAVMSGGTEAISDSAPLCPEPRARENS
jgi:anti-sigma factor ChrR (cupin superfamily)